MWDIPGCNFGKLLKQDCGQGKVSYCENSTLYVPCDLVDLLIIIVT
jgi:hypothetical protein